jgi:hypothetical protein
VSGEGTVPLSAECCHLAREFLYAPQKLVVVCRFASARERGRGNSLDDAVCTVGSSFQLDLLMAGKSSLCFRGKPTGPDGSQEVVRQVRGEASEVSQELRQLAIAHLLERENPVSALLPREGQPFQQLGPQLGVWVLLGRRGDDVLHLCGVSLVQPRFHIMEFCPLTADAGHRELRLSLGEQHGWSLGPERRKPYGHSGYLRRLADVNCLDSSSGSPMWDRARRTECSWLTLNRPPQYWTE